MSSLYILEINSLSVASFADISSHSKGCLFCLIYGFLCCGKAFKFNCSAQLCPILCDPIDFSLPGSSFHGIFQARILEWVTVSFSRRSSQLGIELVSLTYPALAGRFFITSITLDWSSNAYIKRVNCYFRCISQIWISSTFVIFQPQIFFNFHMISCHPLSYHFEFT